MGGGKCPLPWGFMTVLTGVISYPIPAYQNVPIEPQFYQPRRFVISDIALGQTTLVTTSTDHDYVIGQQVRLIIPAIFGSYQLNETFGYVLSIPTTSSFVVSIYSIGADAFIPSPYTATITNITQATSAVVTANNNFHVGQTVVFSSVGGMTEINGLFGIITVRSPTVFTVAINTLTFTPYGSGGIASLAGVPQNQAQTLAIGDANTGQVNASGRTNQSTFIPGSFIDISPN